MNRLFWENIVLTSDWYFRLLPFVMRFVNALGNLHGVLKTQNIGLFKKVINPLLISKTDYAPVLRVLLSSENLYKHLEYSWSADYQPSAALKVLENESAFALFEHLDPPRRTIFACYQIKPAFGSKVIYSKKMQAEHQTLALLQSGTVQEQFDYLSSEQKANYFVKLGF